MRQYQDGEDYFKSLLAKGKQCSVEEEMNLLRRHYKHVINKCPHRDCSAWAELTIWELDRMQKKETKKWDTRSPYEKCRLRACLRWLRRLGVTEIEYDVIVRDYWEDVALVLYLWANPVIASSYPALTGELMY